MVAITNLQVSICLLIIRMEIHPGKTNLDICSIKKFIHQTRHLKFSINLKWILMLENVRNATLPTKAHIWTKQLKRHISWFILTYKRQLWAVFHYGLNALYVRPECHYSNLPIMTQYAITHYRPVSELCLCCVCWRGLYQSSLYDFICHYSFQTSSSWVNYSNMGIVLTPMCGLRVFLQILLMGLFLVFFGMPAVKEYLKPGCHNTC